MNDTPTMSQRADALEEQMSRELDYIVVKSRLYSMAEGDMGPAVERQCDHGEEPERSRADGRRSPSAAMPEKPTLMDFFKYRFGPAAHLLQSAKHAMNSGLSEKMVLASSVARYFDDRLHSRRSRLLGRSTRRALCR